MQPPPPQGQHLEGKGHHETSPGYFYSTVCWRVGRTLHSFSLKTLARSLYSAGKAVASSVALASTTLRLGFHTLLNPPDRSCSFCGGLGPTPIHRYRQSPPPDGWAPLIQPCEPQDYFLRHFWDHYKADQFPMLAELQLHPFCDMCSRGAIHLLKSHGP